ncbi:hypothetical protein PR048_001465 [Dryococelus australis]|uniref:Uncharacterized protein n=1 Tax=Dryococelus australis TaxID=614101 RepID=A0ABQ9IJV0_9NEOP|nr:hypothetical protein PR048_001465 [Dryococelus australis]
MYVRRPRASAAGNKKTWWEQLNLRRLTVLHPLPTFRKRNKIRNTNMPTSRAAVGFCALGLWFWLRADSTYVSSRLPEVFQPREGRRRVQDLTISCCSVYFKGIFWKVLQAILASPVDVPLLSPLFISIWVDQDQLQKDAEPVQTTAGNLEIKYDDVHEMIEFATSRGWFKVGTSATTGNSSRLNVLSLTCKIDVKHVYTEVDFAVGSQFIRHALDDSEPMAGLQGNKGATVAERLARSHPTRANRAQSPARLPDFRKWSASFLGDLPFSPPLHSGAAPYSLQSSPSDLRTSLLKTAQISSLTH